MIDKTAFVLSHELVDPYFLFTYNKIMKNQYMSFDIMNKNQEKLLRYMLHYVDNYIPFYHYLYKKNGIDVNNIKCKNDLNKLPIITKEIINRNWDSFIPLNLSSQKYYNVSTGGSTGSPLKYRISRKERFLGGALLYRGWSYAGYHLGEKMIFLAGASIVPIQKNRQKNKFFEIVRNIRMLSAFDLSEQNCNYYLQIINNFKPKFIRGYPSAISSFAEWVEITGKKIHSPIAVLTTSEKIFPKMRKKICKIFNCDVFDAYGLNDSGLSAFECSAHEGLHIDTERSIFELVTDKGESVNNGEGKIIGTSLHNFSMPFIRYDTGDIGSIISDKCSCSRSNPLLKEIIGRSTDLLSRPNGGKIHGWFILYIFWEYCKGIIQYQVIQDRIDHLMIKLVVGDDFDSNQLIKISELINLREKNWYIDYQIVDHIDVSSSQKFKFIISKIID